MLCTSFQYARNSEFQSEDWLVSVVKLQGDQQWTEYWRRIEVYCEKLQMHHVELAGALLLTEELSINHILRLCRPCLEITLLTLTA